MVFPSISIQHFHMKTFSVFMLAILSVLFTSCEAVGAIFKTGVWVGVLGVVFIIAIILYFIGRAKK